MYECRPLFEPIRTPHSHILLQAVDTRPEEVVEAASDDAARPKTVSHTRKSSLSGGAESEAIAIEVNHM